MFYLFLKRTNLMRLECGRTDKKNLFFLFIGSGTASGGYDVLYEYALRILIKEQNSPKPTNHNPLLMSTKHLVTLYCSHTDCELTNAFSNMI